MEFSHAIIATLMNKLPEVRWDRCAGDMDAGCVYGWLDRDDGRSDFVLFSWRNGDFVTTTSSASFSPVISERIHGNTTGHKPCKRVEDVFGDMVANKVVLPPI